jgi:hypothetical protein
MLAHLCLLPCVPPSLCRIILKTSIQTGPTIPQVSDPTQLRTACSYHSHLVPPQNLVQYQPQPQPQVSRAERLRGGTEYGPGPCACTWLVLITYRHSLSTDNLVSASFFSTFVVVPALASAPEVVYCFRRDISRRLCTLLYLPPFLLWSITSTMMGIYVEQEMQRHA